MAVFAACSAIALLCVAQAGDGNLVATNLGEQQFVSNSSASRFQFADFEPQDSNQRMLFGGELAVDVPTVSDVGFYYFNATLNQDAQYFTLPGAKHLMSGRFRYVWPGTVSFVQSVAHSEMSLEFSTGHPCNSARTDPLDVFGFAKRQVSRVTGTVRSLTSTNAGGLWLAIHAPPFAGVQFRTICESPLGNPLPDFSQQTAHLTWLGDEHSLVRTFGAGGACGLDGEFLNEYWATYNLGGSGGFSIAKSGDLVYYFDTDASTLVPLSEKVFHSFSYDESAVETVWNSYVRMAGIAFLRGLPSGGSCPSPDPARALVEKLGGALIVLVRGSSGTQVGDSASQTSVFNELRSVGMNARGNILLSATQKDSAGNSSNGLWFIQDPIDASVVPHGIPDIGGATRPILQQGDVISRGGVNLGNFSDFVLSPTPLSLNDRNESFNVVRLANPAVSFVLLKTTISLPSPVGVTHEVVLRDGDQAPGLPPGVVINSIGSAVTNSEGDAVFTVMASNNEGRVLYFLPSGESPIVIARANQFVTTPSCESVQLKDFMFQGGSGGTDGRPMSLSNSREFAYAAVIEKDFVTYHAIGTYVHGAEPKNRCDVDCNENVDLFDAQLIARYFLGLPTPEICLAECELDLNDDENVDLEDAQMLADFVVLGTPSGFCP